MNFFYNSNDSNRSRVNSNYEHKNKDDTAIRKITSFHFRINSLNLKKSFLIIFTIFSIVLPIGLQPQLQTTEAFDESVINDNIDGMRDDSNGNGNGKTNKNVRAYEDPASIDSTTSDSQIGTQSSDGNNKILPNDESKEEELGFHASTQSGYKTYSDHINSNTNENSNDNIIVTDDKPGTESSSTDSQLDTTDSESDTTDSQSDTTDSESDTTDHQLDTVKSDVNNSANGQVNENLTVPNSQSIPESTSNATSQSQSSDQPMYKSYRDYINSNTNKNSNDNIIVTDDKPGTESSSTDSQLDTTDSQLDTTDSQLDTTDSQLDTTDSQLDTTDSQLDTTDSQLDTTDSQLDTTDSQLDTTDSQLDTTDSQLDTTDSQLDTTDSQLDTTDSELDTTDSQLDTTDSESDTTDSESDTTDSELDTTDSELDTTDSESDTTDSESDTTDSESDTTDSELDTTDSESDTTDSELDTTDSESDTTDSESDTTDSESDTTDSELDTTDSESDTTDSESDTTDSESDTTDSESDTTDSESDTTDSESDTTDSESDTTDSESDTTDPQLDTTDHQLDPQLDTTDPQLDTTDHQLDPQLDTTDPQLDTTDHQLDPQLDTTDPQLDTTDPQLDTTDHQLDPQLDTTDHQLDTTDPQSDTTDHQLDHQLDTTDHQLDTTDHQLDTTDHQLDTTDHQLDTVKSDVNNSANGQVNENLTIPNSQSIPESTSNATSQPQSSDQPRYKSYRDYINSNANENANEKVTVPDDISSTESTSLTTASTQSSSQLSAQSSNEVYGDFNGDGRDDLAIAVPGEALDSATTGEILSNAGAVHVIYGSPSGLSATTLIKNQIWTQNSPSVADSSEEGDQFGSSLAAGDFNGDGHDDLAIGVHFEDVVSAGDNAGAVNVIYGSSSGLSATTVPDQFWRQDSPNVADSSESDDNFGDSLAAGDFNADGRDDLAIGVFAEDVVSINDNAGAVNVIYGSSSGLSATTVPDQFWRQDSPNVGDSSESGDHFGSSLAAGDFNADGNEDLVIGVNSEDVVSINDNAGAVNVIYGSLSGLSATTVTDQFWTQNSANVEDSSESGDNFGTSLAAGDFNADGNEDLAIGVPNEDVDVGGPIIDSAGAVNVLYGSSNGLSATSPIPDQFWTLGFDSNPIDLFGFSLAGGDFNADGNEDLVIGIPNRGIPSPGNGAGAALVIYGSSGGLSFTAQLPFKFLTQNYPNVEDSSEGGDSFGGSLAAGDFNADGIEDLAIGVIAEDVVSINDNAGAVNVIYGSSVGLSPTQAPVFDQFFSQTSPDIGLAPDAADFFGRSLG